MSEFACGFLWGALWVFWILLAVGIVMMKDNFQRISALLGAAMLNLVVVIVLLIIKVVLMSSR